MKYRLFHDNYFQSYAGNFLLSTEADEKSLFNKALIYICIHDISGAMGVIVNRTLNTVDCHEIISQSELMKINTESVVIKSPTVYIGGPVDIEKSFILHSNDYLLNETIHMPDGLAMTSNRSVLQDMVQGKGPRESMLALGYAAWYPGQLEAEVMNNHWLLTESNKDIIFNAPNDDKWNMALAHAGISYSNYLNIVNCYGRA